MSVPLHFSYPDAWVAIPLDDIHAGAIVAAQNVLSRFAEPVPRADAALLEDRFEALANLMVLAEVNAGFALVPEPPHLGLLGGLLVRWTIALGDDAVADAVAELLGSGEQLIDDAKVTTQETPLGSATVVIRRFLSANQPATPPQRRRRLAKVSSSVTEDIHWFWRVEDHSGPDLLVTVTMSTDDLSLTPAIRGLTEEFALGVRRAD